MFIVWFYWSNLNVSLNLKKVVFEIPQTKINKINTLFANFTKIDKNILEKLKKN